MGAICYKEKKVISRIGTLTQNDRVLMNKLEDYIGKTIIQDSFFNKDDINDSAYNQLKKKELSELTEYFNSKQADFSVQIKNYLNRKSNNLLLDEDVERKKDNRNIQLLNEKIVILENSKDIYKNKVLGEIKKINENTNSFQINYLTIMLVGKSGVGKSTLINKFLKLSGKNRAKTGTGNFQTTNIKSYQSNAVPFLRLIDTRGIELNIQYGADAIKKDAELFIRNQISQGDINNFVHCFWYCITGNRFEQAEIDLLMSLKSSYDDNKIPIIIVYTQATDDNTISEMIKYIKEHHIEGHFIKVLADRKKLTNGTYLESFGLDNLLSETIKKCQKALKGEMRTVMADNIGLHIQKILIEENKKIKQYIKKKIITDFINDYKKKEDEEFINYIMEIYKKNIIYFLNKDMSNESINLFMNSVFIIMTKGFIDYYKNNVDNIIQDDLPKIAYKCLDMQAITEKECGTNISIYNRRTHKEFIDSTKKFFQDNFYYVAQKIYFHFLFVNEYLYKSFETLSNNIIANLLKENNIKGIVSKCYLKKFNQFKERIKVQEPLLIKAINDTNDKNEENEEENEDNHLNNQPAPINNNGGNTNTNYINNNYNDINYNVNLNDEEIENQSENIEEEEYPEESQIYNIQNNNENIKSQENENYYDKP